MRFTTAADPRDGAVRRPDALDDLMARVALRLRQIREPLPPAELDTLVHDIVLEVARFVLEWTERRELSPGTSALLTQE